VSEPTGPVVILAGGTGGAKLARGMLDVVGPDELVVIANTGDDIDIYGAHVSPDPDLVSFWLADLIDERGWGLRDDTFAVMDALRALDTNVWFNLGDRDLAWCIERRRMQDEGLRPTEALARLNQAIGVRTRVLPMCDEPLRTWIRTDAGWRDFQQFMIRDRTEGTVREAAFATPTQGSSIMAPAAPTTAAKAESAARHSGHTPPHAPPAANGAPEPTPEVLAALASARAVIVGPSNPVISIWPILSVLGDALAALAVPIVCVSPVVGGEIVKGPTAAFLAAYGQPVSAAGVAAFYERVQPGLLGAIVADEPVSGLPTLQIDTAMPDVLACTRVASQTLAFAETLARDPRCDSAGEFAGDPAGSLGTHAHRRDPAR
jgi:LPPG:FO 2-phospho-L-lactate transferase